MKQSDARQPQGEPSPKTLRVLFRLGHLSLLVMVAVWIVMFLLKGAPYGKTWEIILLTIFLGRAAAVGAGLSMNFSPFFLFYQAVIADFFIVLYVYPLFVLTFQQMTRAPLIGGYLDNLHRVALRYKTRVAPYGVMGLMIFVIFPFWSTGALVGSIVGYLIGLPVVATLVSVTAGNILAIAVWVWFYDSLHDWNKNAAMALLVLVFALAIGGGLFSRILRARKNRRAREAQVKIETAELTASSGK